MVSETKRFHIGDILSVTTGRVVSPSHIDGVYRILNHLTADNLFMHQLPRASRECAPYLRECFPDLAAVETPDRFDGKEHVDRWLAALVKVHGAERVVESMRDGVHEYRNPLAEAAEYFAPDRIIIVDPDEARP